MNSITISGKVSSGLVTRTSNSGKLVTNFELFDGFFRHTIAAWENMSKRANELKIGDYVVISGSLTYSTDSNGKNFANIKMLYMEKVCDPSEETIAEEMPVVKKMGEW